MQVHCTDTRIDVRTHKYNSKNRQKERHKCRHKNRQIGETHVQTKSTNLTTNTATKRDPSSERNINSSKKKNTNLMYKIRAVPLEKCLEAS